jgi:AcrR family transcriptional regulator
MRCYGAGVPKVVDVEARRREILEATWRVIAREGIEAATMRRIAESAGCTTGLVTHYFAGKDEILIAALREVHAAAGRRMVACLAERRGLAALEAVLLEALPLDAERVQEWKVWLTFWGQALTARALVAEQRSRYAEWRRVVRELLRQARRDRELDPAANVEGCVDETIALVDGLGIQAVFEADRLTPARLRALVREHVRQLRRST